MTHSLNTSPWHSWSLELQYLMFRFKLSLTHLLSVRKDKVVGRRVLQVIVGYVQIWRVCPDLTCLMSSVSPTVHVQCYKLYCYHLFTLFQNKQTKAIFISIPSSKNTLKLSYVKVLCFFGKIFLFALTIGWNETDNFYIFSLVFHTLIYISVAEPILSSCYIKKHCRL